MVYKIGTTADMSRIAIADSKALKIISYYACILTAEYGADRNIDTDYGGYVLYAEPNTSYDEIKSFFDYTQYVAESVEVSEDLCTAVYITSSDYGVVIVMPAEDMPPEIKNTMEV